MIWSFVMLGLSAWFSLKEPGIMNIHEPAKLRTIWRLQFHIPWLFVGAAWLLSLGSAGTDLLIIMLFQSCSIVSDANKVRALFFWGTRGGETMINLAEVHWPLKSLGSLSPLPVEVVAVFGSASQSFALRFDWQVEPQSLHLSACCLKSKGAFNSLFHIACASIECSM